MSYDAAGRYERLPVTRRSPRPHRHGYIFKKDTVAYKEDEKKLPIRKPLVCARPARLSNGL